MSHSDRRPWSLGKKWTGLILRDIGFRKIDRFNRLLESIPGLTPRVLPMRLKELDEKGIIERIETRNSPIVVRWGLTEKGRDTLPILMRLIAFGSKWYPQGGLQGQGPTNNKRTLPESWSEIDHQRLHLNKTSPADWLRYTECFSTPSLSVA